MRDANYVYQAFDPVGRLIAEMRERIRVADQPDHPDHEWLSPEQMAEIKVIAQWAIDGLTSGALTQIDVGGRWNKTIFSWAPLKKRCREKAGKRCCAAS